MWQMHRRLLNIMGYQYTHMTDDIQANHTYPVSNQFNCLGDFVTYSDFGQCEWMSVRDVDLVLTPKNSSTSIRAMCSRLPGGAEYYALSDRLYTEFDHKITHRTHVKTAPRKFLVVVRDPAQRLKSAIDMYLHDWHRYYGAHNADWRVFTGVGSATDTHVLPQIGYIPVRRNLNIGRYCTGLVNSVGDPVNPGVFSDIISDVPLLQVLEQSPDEYIFFRQDGRRNVVQDIAQYLNISGDVMDYVSQTRVNSSQARGINPQDPRFTDVHHRLFRGWIKKFYQADLEFYTSVRCEND